jgi:hypothetical protein
VQTANVVLIVNVHHPINVVLNAHVIILRRRNHVHVVRTARVETNVNAHQKINAVQNVHVIRARLLRRDLVAVERNKIKT